MCAVYLDIKDDGTQSKKEINDKNETKSPEMSDGPSWKKMCSQISGIDQSVFSNASLLATDMARGITFLGWMSIHLFIPFS